MASGAGYIQAAELIVPVDSEATALRVLQSYRESMGDGLLAGRIIRPRRGRRDWLVQVLVELPDGAKVPYGMRRVVVPRTLVEILRGDEEGPC
jgi:hypothetical protein